MAGRNLTVWARRAGVISDLLPGWKRVRLLTGIDASHGIERSSGV